MRGTSTGTRSDISTTSFYGSHVINCAGNGGMLCVNREDWLEEAKLLRSWGRSSSLFVESEEIENRFNVDVGGIPYDAKFVFSRIGYNLEPSEMGASFGLVQLDRLEGNISVRERNFDRQLAFFAEYEDWFILPRQLPTPAPAGWLSRSSFAMTLRSGAATCRFTSSAQNIQTRTVFTGNVLRQPGFAEIERREAPDGYPNADAVMRGGMLLGCHHGLSDAAARLRPRAVSCVRRVLLTLRPAVADEMEEGADGDDQPASKRRPRQAGCRHAPRVRGDA